MANAFSADDLVLLGYEDITELEIDDSVIALSGKVSAGVVQAEHAFVYIKTDATREDLIRVSKRLAQKSVYLLRSPSGPNESLLRSVFGKDAQILLIDELLWKKVSELFSSYLLSIRESISSEPHFIAPRGEDLQQKDRLDEYLVEYFTKKRERGDLRKGLVVLKADAGVGKTTLCRQLVKEFAKGVLRYRVVPVYVEAAQWGGHVASTEHLWDIIQLSIQNFDSGKAISRGLFEAALRRGLIVFVLDGFDELSASPKSILSAAEMLDGLRALADDSEARVVLTTRTPFWNAEIGVDPQEVYSLRLLPFNPQQAKEYIKKFFEKDDARFQTARQLYAAVIEHAANPDNEGGARAQFWSLPIAVSMICEAVKAGVSLADWSEFSLESLLVAICERETKRQNLAISGSKQLAIFKEIALLDSGSEIARFEQEDLLAAGVSDSDAKKFNSHPLLKEVSGGYSFAYDFIAPFLRALAIRDSVDEQNSAVRGPIIDAMRSEENGKGFQLEHLARLMRNRSAEDVYAFVRRLPPAELGARCFVSHLLQKISVTQGNVVDASDRAGMLYRAFGEGVEIRNTRFTGVFEGIDFSNASFSNCEFIDVSFKNVSFKNAVFRACKFDGDVLFLTESDEQNFSTSKLEGDCEIRPSARLALQPVLSRTPENKAELVADLLEAGLSKFWHNGKFRGTIRKADWKKGPVGRSRSADPLLETFKRTGIIADTVISGVREGGWLFNRDAIGDLQNFMDHRQITGKVKAAFDELCDLL